MYDDDFGGSSPSPQRSLRIAGAASVGSLLAVAAIFVVGGSSSHAGPASDVNGTTLATGSAPGRLSIVTAAASAGGTAPASTMCTSQYTVEAGDGWLVIAKRAGVPVDQLYSVNGTSSASALQPGQVVCLPAGATVTTTATTTGSTTATTTATTKAMTTRVTTPTTVKHTVVTAPKVTTPTTVKHSISASS
jgi:LysM repeat protein